MFFQTATWPSIRGVTPGDMTESSRFSTKTCAVLSKAANRTTLHVHITPAITKSFVRAGARSKPQRSKDKPQTLLEHANDWNILIDGIPQRTRFPPCTGDTNLRPDIMIYSLSKKIMIWAELTVPLEENVIDAAIRKTERYLDRARQEPTIKTVDRSPLYDRGGLYRLCCRLYDEVSPNNRGQPSTEKVAPETNFALCSQGLIPDLVQPILQEVGESRTHTFCCF